MSTFGPYPAKVLRPVDGDTVDLAVDLGFDVTYKARVRLVGVNAAERGTPAGDAATRFLQALLPPGEPVWLLSQGWDKFGGRVDGTIKAPSAGGDIAQLLLEAGHAKPWDGKGPRP